MAPKTDELVFVGMECGGMENQARTGAGAAASLAIASILGLRSPSSCQRSGQAENMRKEIIDASVNPTPKKKGLQPIDRNPLIF